MKHISTIVFFLFMLLSCNADSNYSEMPGWRVEYFFGTPVYELAIAVRNDDIEGVKENVKKSIDINYRDKKNGCTVLMYAVVYSKTEIIKILLKNGADPNISDKKFDENSLILAVKNKGKYSDCNMEIIKLILKHGGDVNSQQEFQYKMDNNGINQTNTNLINIASQRGCLNIVKLLVENGAKYKFENSNIILDALLQDNLDIVKYFIIDKKIDIPEYLFIRSGTQNVKDDKYITVESYLNERNYEEDIEKKKLKEEILKFLNRTNNVTKQ